ncbi:TonB-dependent siderophore receptor [Aquimarina hainanensis]|uniref:TonB-dependent siderophore receptor n=1 Tax=Aquimarina hainanensis TaxID=1578017 RepID=A0ABW5N9A7_9FLAO
MKNLSMRIGNAILVITFLLLGSAGYSQATNSITGKVFTSDGQPAAYINVLINNTARGALTDQNGTYTFHNVDAGDYEFVFSLIGLKSQTINVQVAEEGITSVKDITLEVDEQKLQEVIVIAERLNQFARKETEQVARLPLKNINNPQSYTVVSSELLKEQINTDLPSALKSITGGGYVEGNQGFASVYARGFRADSNIKNGLRVYTKYPIDPQNIDRIEVIKGPSSVLFGAGYYGGLVNLVTKKPFEGKKLDVSYTLGSWDLNRFTVDFNTALDKENKTLLRVNGAYHSENSFQNQGFHRSFMVAPSITHKVSDKLDLEFNAEINHSKKTKNFARGIARGGIEGANSWDDINWDYNESYTSNEAAGDVKSQLYQLFANYKIKDNWISKTSISSNNYHLTDNYVYLEAIAKDTINRGIIQFSHGNGGTLDLRQDFQGIHTSDAIENKIVIGVNYVNTFWDFTIKNGPVVNGRSHWNFPYDQIVLNGENTIVPPITRRGLDEADGSIAARETGNKNLAAYISDAITIQKKLTLLGGIRFDRFMNDPSISNGISRGGYNQNNISYNAGIVYNPFGDKLGIFGNYMNGFKNVAPGIMDAEGEIVDFDPEEVNQWETGVKLNLLDGKIKSTVSYYNITIDNAIRRFNGFSTQDGEIVSSGIEADLIANPLPGLNMVLGYTYNHSEHKKHANPQFDGRQLTLTPETVANFWISYRVLKGQLSGLGAGFGGNHMSKIYQVSSLDNSFWANDYTTFDGTIFYDQPNYRIGFKINNMFDKEYYNAYGMPQKPLNVNVGFTYKL